MSSRHVRSVRLATRQASADGDVDMGFATGIGLPRRWKPASTPRWLSVLNGMQLLWIRPMVLLTVALMLLATLLFGCSSVSEGAVTAAVSNAQSVDLSEISIIDLADPLDQEDLDNTAAADIDDELSEEDLASSVTLDDQDPNAGKTWHGPWDEQVLVSAAWTEEVYHAATYTTVHHSEVGHHGSRCNQCGMDITGFASQHMHERAPLCWSYSSSYFVDSPEWDEQVVASAAWTEYINHPAVYRTVHHDGYWE